MKDKISKIVCNTFEIDFFDENIPFMDFYEWDSLVSMVFVDRLDNEFGISFEITELGKYTFNSLVIKIENHLWRS
jgi:acyl carrier protein